MKSLLDYQAKRCLTAAGMVIYQKRILLIKHKKLQIWFCPGGHVDENELPHQAAEREFFEETGIKVQAFDPHYQHQGDESEYYPSPIETNLHWVCEENYRRRIKSPNSYQVVEQWPKGCEQHLGFVYLVKPVDENKLEIKHNKREVADIGWFSLEESQQLPTTNDMKQQFAHGFEVVAAIG